ncbi:MAG: sigma-54-dependent transcriptional regulator [Pseudomonadota bacterium]|jgi:DNA-binding NtrC family response regulator
MSVTEKPVKILAVDDNPEALFALEQLLLSRGFEVVTAASGSETLAKAEAERPDLILLDVVMPEPNGYEVAKTLKAHPELRYTTIVLLTGRDELKDILFGFEQGADDYICKPYQSAELIARVHAALRVRKLYGELRNARVTNRQLQARLGEQFSFDTIIGQSAAMRGLYQVMAKVVDSDVPVLITGESGTGKEMVATALHANGPRKDRPFVVQNCSAFNENLLESELFGHVKGAFTGAMRDKQGLFEVADGGTFFLDELGEMSPALQVKLLRVLQDGTFMPVGGTKQRKVDVRILAATNRNLEEMVKRGTFREDLYYRLNVVGLELPPLRQREGDVPLLAKFFLNKIADRTKQPVKGIAPDAMACLERYQWPGNIRQLENEVQRACVMSGKESVITRECLSPTVAGIEIPTSKVEMGQERPLKDVLDQVEREMIEGALTRCEGNKSEAARQLGIARSNLIAKCRDYGLE